AAAVDEPGAGALDLLPDRPRAGQEVPPGGGQARALVVGQGPPADVVARQVGGKARPRLRVSPARRLLEGHQAQRHAAPGEALEVRPDLRGPERVERAVV